MNTVVTVVLPTYRRSHLLRRAINSVLRQEFTNLELLIVDDASGDDTAETVRSFMHDSRIRYVCNPKNVGATDNFASAIGMVRTRYFSIMGDDEILLPGFYRTTLAALEQKPDAGFSCAPVIVLGPDRKLDWRRPDYFPVGYYSPPEGFRRMLELGFPGITGIVYRTFLRDEMGGLDPNVGHYWDFELSARYATRYPFVVTGEPGAIFTEEAQSPYRQANKHLLPGYQHAQNWWRKVESEYALPRELAAETAATLRRRYGKSLYRAALDWAADGDVEDLARAYSILRELNHDKQGRIGRILTLARFAPHVLKLYRLRKRLSDSPLFAARKARKARRKFGDSLQYEKVIEQFD